MIDIKDLYQKTNKGLDIITWIYPQATAKHKFAIRTGSDDDPSASLQLRTTKYGEVWGLTDFGDDSHWKSPIDLYVAYKNMSKEDFYVALQEIAEQFGCTPMIINNTNKPLVEKRPALPNEADKTRRWEYMDVTEESLAIMGRTVRKEHLEQLGWKLASFVKFTDNGQTYVKYTNEKYPIFIRECVIEETDGNTKSFYKIYEPLNAEKKYRFSVYPTGGRPENYINGLYELKKAYMEYNQTKCAEHEGSKKNEDKEFTPVKLPAAVICSGERDALCCLSQGLYPIWFNSETYHVEKSDIITISKYVQVIYNIPDIDDTGIKKGKDRLASE